MYTVLEVESGPEIHPIGCVTIQCHKMTPKCRYCSFTSTKITFNLMSYIYRYLKRIGEITNEYFYHFRHF